MDNAELMVRYRRFLKRKNYSVHTVKNYLNILGQFSLWLKMPIEEVTQKEIGAYTEHLLRKGRNLRPLTATSEVSVPSTTIFTTKRGYPLSIWLKRPIGFVFRNRSPNTSKTSRSRYSLKRLKTREIGPCSC